MDPSVLEDSENLTLEGVEEIDGVMTYRVSMFVESESIAIVEDLGRGMDVNFWVGTEDGLLRRILAVGQVDVPDMDTPQPDGLFGGFATEEASFEMLIEYSNFNAPIQIEPPEDFIEMRNMRPRSQK